MILFSIKIQKNLRCSYCFINRFLVDCITLGTIQLSRFPYENIQELSFFLLFDLPKQKSHGLIFQIRDLFPSFFWFSFLNTKHLSPGKGNEAGEQGWEWNFSLVVFYWVWKPSQLKTIKTYYLTVRSPGWIDWFLYSGLHKAEITVLSGFVPYWRFWRGICFLGPLGCWLSQLLVVVGLKFQCVSGSGGLFLETPGCLHPSQPLGPQLMNLIHSWNLSTFPFCCTSLSLAEKFLCF